MLRKELLTAAYQNSTTFLVFSAIVILAFSTASSILLGAPGIKIPAFFGSMVLLSWGPMVTHILRGASTSRWILDIVWSLGLLGMISSRLRWQSRVLPLISFVGVLLWYSSAFVIVWLNYDV